MENSEIDVLEKKVKELEKNNKVLEIQIKVNNNMLKVLKQQNEETKVFYQNAIRSCHSLMQKQKEETKPLLVCCRKRKRCETGLINGENGRDIKRAAEGQ